MGHELKKINVFLIKRNVRELNKVIKFRSKENPKKIFLDPQIPTEEGAFYLGESSQKEPEWLDFLNEMIPKQNQQTLKLNTTNSAVLVLKVDKRIFAFCFGYGRFFIDMAVIERQFGLKVALNIIDPKELRTMDYKKYEEVVINTRRQVSRGSSLRMFEIDINSELLRNIGGKVKSNDDSIGNSVYGSDSVILNLKESVEKNNIVSVCRELFDLYSRSDYKEYFDFIDYYQTETDPKTIERLDGKLVSAINNTENINFHMAPPEIFDYENSDGFSFLTPPSEEDYPKAELDPVDYISSFKKFISNLTSQELKNHQVWVKSSSTNTWNDMWPVYNCIVFETDMDNKYYVLHEGLWFMVEKNFAEQLNREIKSIKKAVIDLPPVPGDIQNEVKNRFSEEEQKNLKLAHEKYYNEYVGWKCDDKVTLDRREIVPTGSKTRIEFCDIITTEGQFVHVKPGTSSSKLSHLFKQGTVSAELFVSDAKLRDKVRKIIENDPIFDKFPNWTESDKQHERDLPKRKNLLKLFPSMKDTIDRSEFEVVYCIIKNMSDDQWPDKLPFFSKVSLRREKRAIEKLGLKVSLIKV